MKLIIVTIVALFAIANAQQLSQVQNAGQVGNVGQIRQCSCNDQYNGFREFKEFTNQCFDQCRVAPTSELRTLLDTPVKIYPCLDHKVDMLHKMFDCLNGRLIQADSCASETQATSGNQGQSVSNQDFRQLIAQYMDPLFDQVVSAMEVLDQQSNQHFARNVIGLGSCAPNCLLDKIKQSRFFDITSGCIPRINGNQLQQHIQMCFSEMNLRNTIYKVCTCGVGVGASQLQQFCRQLNSVQFPQFAQGQISDSMDFGIMGERDQQQFGQQQQQQQRFGQSLGLYPRGQIMRVNLAIQQEPGTPGSFFQGSTGGFGNRGYDQNQKSGADTTGNIGFY